jgi:uncharacterized protein (TIGR00251 family)
MQMNTTGAVAVRVTTRARVDEVAGWRGNTLLIRVKAPPIDGRANNAVRQVLASALGIRASEIEIVTGSSSRNKTVRLPASALARLNPPG